MVAELVRLTVVGVDVFIHSADSGEEIVCSARPVGGIALPKVFALGAFRLNGLQLRAQRIDGDFQVFIFDGIYHNLAP